MNRFIAKLIQNGENEQLDFKQEISDPIRIAKTIVSFANHKGGRLLVGVCDDGRILGINADDEIHMLEIAALTLIKPSLKYYVNQHEESNKTVLEVIIPEGKDKPYYAKGSDQKWWVYIRVKDQSLLASKVVIHVLRKSTDEDKSLIRFGSKEKALLDYLKSHHKITIKQYCKLLNISRRRATAIISDLIQGGIVRAHYTEKPEYYTLS